MRRLLFAAFFVATLLSFETSFVSACGDKLLTLGRGLKFRDISSSYHGTIIAYIPESVLQSAAINDSQFQQGLRKAGHRLRLVREADVLAAAVQSGTYDIILVDLRDTTMVETQVNNFAVHTVVIPVVYDGADLRSVPDLKKYRCIRKISGKNSACLSTIDRAIEFKLKQDEQQRRASK